MWIPILFVWPTVFFGGSTAVSIMAFFGNITYFGAFFAYWAELGFMAWTFYIDPATAKSTFA